MIRSSAPGSLLKWCVWLSQFLFVSSSSRSAPRTVSFSLPIKSHWSPINNQEGRTCSVSSFGSIKSKQWENSHPVKVSLYVINHQLNSQWSAANITECFEYQIQPPPETRGGGDKCNNCNNKAEHVICYRAVTRYRAPRAAGH